MFGKIRDKLKSIFDKNEEIVEESPDKVEEVIVEKPKKEVNKKEQKKEVVKEAPKDENQNLDSNEEEKGDKKGFFSKIFKKKEEAQEELVVEDKVEEAIVEKPKKEVKVKELKREIPREEPEELEDEVEEIEDSKVKVKKSNKNEISSETPAQDIENVINELKEDENKENIFEDSEEDESNIIDDTKKNSLPKEEIIEGDKKGFFSKIFKKKEGAQEERDKEGSESEIESKNELEDSIEEKIEIKKESIISKTFSKLKSKKIEEGDFEKIWVELELFLLEINIAYEIVEKIENKLKETLIGNSFNRFNLNDAIRKVLISEVENVMKDREASFLNDITKVRIEKEPVKILVLGVNGTGKTTTIAKVVKYLRDNGLSSVVAAADTFRAAAVEQLEEHSKKLNFKLIQHKGGSDPAAVAFDAIEHAKARGIDVVLIDTAGRMPNNSNLMMELQKIKKVSKSELAIFIGDSISGNDLIDQIELFDKGVEINGIILTKVDTDDKPGSIVTTAFSIEKPIYFLGNGQTYNDLVEFHSKEIATKLFSIEDE